MIYPNSKPTDSEMMYLDPAAKADIEAMMDGDPELIIDLIDTMMETTPDLMDQLVDGIQAADDAQVRSAAHALKSSAAQFGAKAFSGICLELEEMGRSQQANQAKAKLSTLQAAYQGMKAALCQWKTDLST